LNCGERFLRRLQGREIEAAKKAVAKVQAERAKEHIIRDFPWPRCDIWEDSPARLTGAADIAETRSFLSLAFSKGDLLWIGRPEHSNEAGAIRTLEEWLTDDAVLLRPSVCPNVLATIQGGRKNVNILELRYVVIEADKLSPDHEDNQDLTGALIRWLRESVGLNLFAIISSGGKSLHAWFAVDDRLKQFIESPSAKNLLASLGLDTASVRPEQAFRFPGHVRHETGQTQTIYYLDPAAGFNRRRVSTQQQPPWQRRSTDEG
jgi:hypothetical protein